MDAPAYPARSDAQLVSAIRAGDAHALQALSLRYSRMLTAVAWRFLGDEAGAEEVVSDVFWKVWSDAKAFDAAQGSVAAWLVYLARNRAIDCLRTRSMHQGEIEKAPTQASTDAGDDLDEAEHVQSVRAAVATLEAEQRAVLEMVYFSDLSFAEIAERLGIPAETVKAKISGAMIKLRQALANRQK